MTVKDLIAKLQTQNPDAKIGIKAKFNFDLVYEISGLLKVTEDCPEFGTIVLAPSEVLAVGTVGQASEVELSPF